MSHYVLENCIGCKYTDCVDVCPIDCFHEGPNFIVIDPDECIDCGLCISECPVKAIKTEWELTKEEKMFINLNLELSKKWPIINKKKSPLPTAEIEKNQKNKINKLIR